VCTRLWVGCDVIYFYFLLLLEDCVRGKEEMMVNGVLGGFLGVCQVELLLFYSYSSPYHLHA
jgi:hypothetical protein